MATFRTALLLSFCLSAWTVSVPGQHDPRAGGWAHDRSRLQPDPQVVWGSLDNGLRYAFLPHNGVPGRVSLRLLVLAGSLDEEDRERGLAHFLEHMAFDGTRNFKPDEMTEYFQRLGMEFGSDVNAFTTTDHTVYALEFTRSEPELIRDGFLLFRDFADGLTLDPQEIEDERGVILSERRIHDGLSFRLNEAANRFFFEGMLFPERNPIGTIDIIRRAGREDLLRFYQRMYRSDQMILIGTGDLDVAQFQTWTHELFSDLRRPTGRLPERRLGQPARQRGPRAAVLPVMHTGSASVRAAAVVQERSREDSLEARRQEAHRRFAADLLGNRLDKLVLHGGGGMAEYARLGDVSVGIASLAVGGEDWEHGVLGVDRIIRYTQDRGFQASEVERPRRRRLLEAGTMRAQAPTMDPAPLADRITESIVSGQVYVGFDREMQMEENFLSTVTLDDLTRAVRDIWPIDRLSYFVQGEVSIPGGSDAVVRTLRTSRRSAADSVLPPPPPLQASYRPANRGRPGTVVETETLEDFGAKLMRFENNVRFNFISSQREPGLVRAIVRVGGGLFEVPGIRPGLREFALETVLGSGTSRHRAEQVQSLLEDIMVDFSFDVADHDAFTFRGACGSEDLETFLGLVSEFLHSPQFSRSAQQSVKFGAAMARMSQSFGVPDGVRAFHDHIFAGDGRFAWGTPFDYHALGITHVRGWLGRALESGYVEVSLIGDISEANALAVVARTFGNLPPRQETKRTPNPRPIRIVPLPGTARLEFVGEDHQAAALGTWPVMAKTDLSDRLALLLVSRVLEQRMRLLFRERLALAYSPEAEFLAYLEYPDFALIQAHVDCAPEDASRIAEALATIAAEMAREGVTETEFEGALNPIHGHVVQALRTNDMLLDRLLKRAQERPETIEELRAVRDGALRSLTLAQVNQLAATVLSADNTRTAAIVPRAFVGLFQIDTGSGGQPIIGR